MAADNFAWMHWPSHGWALLKQWLLDHYNSHAHDGDETAKLAPSAIDGVTSDATELNYLDGSTPGTNVSGKALVPSSTGAIDKLLFTPAAVVAPSGAIAGEADAFTQPGAPTTVEILQALDVAGDRGRGIVVVGNTAGGAVAETILLDGTATTTPVVSTNTFISVAAVYTANGAVLDGQAVTVRCWTARP